MLTHGNSGCDYELRCFIIGFNNSRPTNLFGHGGKKVTQTLRVRLIEYGESVALVRQIVNYVKEAIASAGDCIREGNSADNA